MKTVPWWLATVLSMSGALTLPLAAQQTVPPVAVAGLNLIDAGRVDSALALWAGSEAFGDQERQQITASAPMFRQACGAVSGHEFLRTVEIVPHVERLYLVVRCAVRPVFLMLALYEAPTGWKVTALNWSTDPDRVLPASFFGMQRP